MWSSFCCFQPFPPHMALLKDLGACKRSRDGHGEARGRGVDGVAMQEDTH